MTNDTASSLAAGCYEMIGSENYGNFLKALGSGMIQRNISEKEKPTIAISITDGVWTIRTLTEYNTTEIRFEPGKEFSEELSDGRLGTGVCTLEGDKLVHIWRGAGYESWITSEFYPTELKQTYSSKGVTAVRVFKRT